MWQLRNDWPTAEFIRNASRHKNVSLGLWGFFTTQILVFGPLNSLFWIPGLAWLLLAERQDHEGRFGRRQMTTGSARS